MILKVFSADWRQYFDSLVKVSNGKLANGHSAEKHRASTDDQLLKSQHNGTTANSSVGPSNGSVVHAEQRNGLLEDDTMITPDGIATGHALALAEGHVQLPGCSRRGSKTCPIA